MRILSTTIWIKMAIVTAGNESYHVDQKLMDLWETNSLKNLDEQNIDKAYIVDGRERIGKSTWTIQQMGALEPSVFDSVETFLSRICLTAEEFNNTCKEVKNGVVVFDEGFRGLSSRAALSKTNKKIIQTLMEMGQNNNIIFIVSPSIFLLDVYPAMMRSDGLFHIVQDKKNRKLRTWQGYNRSDKNKIYQLGIRKGWKFAFGSKFRGRFFHKFPGGKKFSDAYEAKKRRSWEDKEEEEKVDKFMLQRNILLAKWYEEPLIYNTQNRQSFRKYSAYLKNLGITLSRTELAKIRKKTPEKLENTAIGNL